MTRLPDSGRNELNWMSLKVLNGLQEFGGKGL